MKAKAVKMADGVYWVGVIHWNSRTSWYSVKKRLY